MTRYEYGQVMSVLSKLINQERRNRDEFIKLNPFLADGRKRDCDIVCGYMVYAMHEMEKVCRPMLKED